MLFRLDLVIAVALSATALVWGMPRGRRNRLLAGFAVGVAPYVVHLATAGPGNVWRGMVLDPVFHLRGGRSLPIPPPWGHLDGFLQKAGALQQLSWPIPAPRASQQLFLWFFLLLGVVAFLLVQGVAGVPRATRRRSAPARCSSSRCSALGILPQALQRVDSAHFAWVGCVPFGFLPVALYEFAAPPRAPRPRVRTLALASAARSRSR